MTVYLKKM